MKFSIKEEQFKLSSKNSSEERKARYPVDAIYYEEQQEAMFVKLHGPKSYDWIITLIENFKSVAGLDGSDPIEFQITRYPKSFSIAVAAGIDQFIEFLKFNDLISEVTYDQVKEKYSQCAVDERKTHNKFSRFFNKVDLRSEDAPLLTKNNHGDSAITHLKRFLRINN